MKKLLLVVLLLVVSNSYSQIDTVKTNPVLYLYVDKMPKINYEGGLSQYLHDSLKWPYQIDAIDEILISFVVSKNGDVKDLKIEKGLVDLFKEEIIRVVKAMPKWTPGEVNSGTVDTKLYLPIMFILKQKQKN